MALGIFASWKRVSEHGVKPRYAFIVTYGRSGSTVLQKIIASISGCHFNGENSDALAGLWASYRSACATRSEQGDVPRTRSGDPWRGAHLIDPQSYNRKLASLFVDEILRPPPDAALIGFKEVRYFDHGEALPDYLDYIRTTFAPALLIFNRRDPVAVANSAWWKNHPADIAAEVRRFDAQTDLYARLYPAETIIVDYDAFCRDPDHLRPLFERLGADFDRGRLAGLMAERLNH